MHDIEQNLTRYLEMERLLNVFFSSLDYCISTCIPVEKEKNGNRPAAGCCRRKNYSLYDLSHPAFERLREEREKRYGKPEDVSRKNPVSVCEYHNPDEGCLLATHKSPVCLAFVCPEFIDFLRDTYGLYVYDYLGVNYALEWILTGDFPEAQYTEFRDSILGMIESVRAARTAGAAPPGNGQCSNSDPPPTKSS